MEKRFCISNPVRRKEEVILCVMVFTLPGDTGEGLFPGSGGLQAKQVVPMHGGGCDLSSGIGRCHAVSVICEFSPIDIISVCVCVRSLICVCYVWLLYCLYF